MKFPRQIYAIQHNVTKRIYIGSSVDPRTRYLNHICLLRNGNHHIEDMQDDFDEYGEEYSLFILETINTYEEREKEYDWMKKYESYTRGIGYNYMDPTALRKANMPIPLKEGVPVMPPGALKA